MPLRVVGGEPRLKGREGARLEEYMPIGAGHVGAAAEAGWWGRLQAVHFGRGGGRAEEGPRASSRRWELAPTRNTWMRLVTRLGRRGALIDPWEEEAGSDACMYCGGGHACKFVAGVWGRKPKLRRIGTMNILFQQMATIGQWSSS